MWPCDPTSVPPSSKDSKARKTWPLCRKLTTTAKKKKKKNSPSLWCPGLAPTTAVWFCLVKRVRGRADYGGDPLPHGQGELWSPLIRHIAPHHTLKARPKVTTNSLLSRRWPITQMCLLLVPPLPRWSLLARLMARENNPRRGGVQEFSWNNWSHVSRRRGELWCAFPLIFGGDIMRFLWYRDCFRSPRPQPQTAEMEVAEALENYPRHSHHKRQHYHYYKHALDTSHLDTGSPQLGLFRHKP